MVYFLNRLKFGKGDFRGRKIEILSILVSKKTFPDLSNKIKKEKNTLILKKSTLLFCQLKKSI